MPHHQLHIAQRQLRVASHSRGCTVAQIVQRPICSEGGVGSLEHPVCCVVIQRPSWSAKCPPHGLSATLGDLAVQLFLIQPQPDERIRRRGQRLHRPSSLAHHGDQLLSRVDVAVPQPQQLRRPCPSRDPERHQRPVPIRPQRAEQLVEPVIGDSARNPMRNLRPISPNPLARPPVHRIVMCMRSPRPPRRIQREWIQDRTGSDIAVKVIEAPQHRLRVHNGRRSVSVSQSRLTSDRIRLSRNTIRPNSAAATIDPAPLFHGQLDPAAEITGLDSGRTVPADINRLQKPPPPQQIHAIRAQRRRRPAHGQQLSQEHRHRLDHDSVETQQPIRLGRLAGGL